LSLFLFAKPFVRRLLLLLAALNVAGFAAAAVFGWQRASAENGHVENLQMAMLGLALLAGAVAAWRAAGLARAVFACWVAVLVLMIQREFDFSVATPGSWLARLHDNDVRLAFWLPVLAILLVWTLRHWRALGRSLAALRWRHLWPIAAVGVLAVSSELMETAAKSAGDMTHVLVFFEELVELNDYGILAAMGIAFAARAGRPATPQQIEARNRLDPAA
jgi:hypothetical protein